MNPSKENSTETPALPAIKPLKFSQNWNGKLNTNFYSSVRFGRNYQIGDVVPVVLREESIGSAKVIMAHALRLDQITDYMALLDCGKSANYLKAMLRKMYSKQNADWSQPCLTAYIFETIRENKN